MKKILVLLLIGVFAVSAAHAQSRKSEQAKAWKKFQAAVAKNDKAAVAALLKYPFEASIANTGGDYAVSTKADLIKHYAKIFTAPRRRSIARAKYEPISDEDEFNVEVSDDLGIHVFRFLKIGAAYFLVGTLGVG